MPNIVGTAVGTAGGYPERMEVKMDKDSIKSYRNACLANINICFSRIEDDLLAQESFSQQRISDAQKRMHSEINTTKLLENKTIALELKLIKIKKNLFVKILMFLRFVK